MFPELLPAGGAARPALPAHRTAAPVLFAPSPHAERRLWEFFTAHIRKDTFAAVLAACGRSVAMFDDSEGTSKREAQRVFLHGTVRPLGRLLAAERSAKLETPVSLSVDRLYMHDLDGRAGAFQKLVAGGMDPSQAAAVSGLLATDD